MRNRAGGSGAAVFNPLPSLGPAPRLRLRLKLRWR